MDKPHASEEPRIGAVDVDSLSPWLDEPGAPIQDLIEQMPFLRTPAQARKFLEGVRAGLADARAGQTLSHEEFLARRAEQRRQYLAEHKG